MVYFLQLTASIIGVFVLICSILGLANVSSNWFTLGGVAHCGTTGCGAAQLPLTAFRVGGYVALICCIVATVSSAIGVVLAFLRSINFGVRVMTVLAGVGFVVAFIALLLAWVAYLALFLVACNTHHGYTCSFSPDYAWIIVIVGMVLAIPAFIFCFVGHDKENYSH